MAEIRPFRGVRYDIARVGGLREVIGPPDDILSNERAAALTAGHPYHSVRLEMRDPTPGDRFAAAGARFRQWLAAGILVRDARPAFYAYEHEYAFGGERHRRRGFFAALRLTDPAEGMVRPHEGLLPENLEERLALLRGLQANLSAVYTLVQDEGRLAPILARVMAAPPDQSGTDDEGGVHRLWVVTDPATIAALQGVVDGRTLYIADGHHRYAAALIYRDERRRATGDAGPAEYVLTHIAAVDDPGVLVLPIHRIVHDVDANAWGTVVDHLARHFAVTREPLPEGDPGPTVAAALARLGAVDGPPAYLLLEPGARRMATVRLRRWDEVECVLPAESSGLTRRLDATVADAVVLAHVLGIHNGAIEERVAFTPDIAEAVRVTRRDTAATALLVRPTRIDSLLAVASAGELMPQKSTYFYPKIPIGLVVYDCTTNDGQGGASTS
ncbi:MAG: DUF1015 domain-containing protein [Sphaerobacter sp.]|nr:DUF1015 domain-containing protein [Sphaerobacter sp.]